MENTEEVLVALVKLKLKASGNSAGAIAMCPHLFDACVAKGLVEPAKFVGHPFGYATSLLSSFKAPVLTSPDLAKWDFHISDSIEL